MYPFEIILITDRPAKSLIEVKTTVEFLLQRRVAAELRR
jgi:hypothetical protein